MSFTPSPSRPTGVRRTARHYPGPPRTEDREWGKEGDGSCKKGRKDRGRWVREVDPSLKGEDPGYATTGFRPEVPEKRLGSDGTCRERRRENPNRHKVTSERMKDRLLLVQSVLSPASRTLPDSDFTLSQRPGSRSVTPGEFARDGSGVHRRSCPGPPTPSWSVGGVPFP